MVFWIVLKKELFIIDNDIHISHVYIVPEKYLYFREGIFNVLQENMVVIPADCEC